MKNKVEDVKELRKEIALLREVNKELTETLKDIASTFTNSAKIIKDIADLVESKYGHE